MTRKAKFGIAVALMLITGSLTAFVAFSIRAHFLYKCQVETAKDVELDGIALECYARDHGGMYPPPPSPVNDRLIRSYAHYQPLHYYPPAAWPIGSGRDITWLLPYLQPKYMTHLILSDHWEKPIYCEITPDRRHYTVVSFGRDGILDAVHSDNWDTAEYDHDWTFSDGEFISIPTGATRR